MHLQLRVEHSHTEIKHGKRQEDADPKADTPDGVEMVLACCRKDDKEDRYGQGPTKL